MGHAKLTSNDHSGQWPAFLRDKSVNNAPNTTVGTPVVVEMSVKGAESKLEELLTQNTVLEVIDSYDEQLAELLLSKDAHLYRANESVQIHSLADQLDKHYGKTPSWKLGSWVYYPWNGKLLHVIERKSFNDLHTIRNRDLITKEEQERLAAFNIACLGMSVGSSSALALALSGISDKIKLADGAVISGSNLNRILAGIQNIGQAKTLVIQQKLYEMNPYLDVFSLKSKVTKSNLNELFEKPWKINLVIDEIDDLEMKILVRVEARKRQIPVLMATELGDSVMLDVERFDLDSTIPLFHGLVPNIEDVLRKKDMTGREWMKYATAIIGPDNVPLNMQQSLLKIGTKVVTHPQLGGTAMMTGGVLAFAAKQIALGHSLPSMRKSISLEKVFLKEHSSYKHKRKHAKHTKILKRSLGSM
ncbi:MAG TPA: ThiF family adenylyltransferase [Candidatus Saccharimonadales bacterium]|nr:ThiF family adenylyltransferase [Candidatus Saccharimonadales bacterium]